MTNSVQISTENLDFILGYIYFFNLFFLCNSLNICCVGLAITCTGGLGVRGVWDFVNVSSMVTINLVIIVVDSHTHRIRVIIIASCNNQLYFYFIEVLWCFFLYSFIHTAKIVLFNRLGSLSTTPTLDD